MRFIDTVRETTRGKKSFLRFFSNDDSAFDERARPDGTRDAPLLFVFGLHDLTLADRQPQVIHIEALVC